MMQTTDRWAGQLVCFLLSPFARKKKSPPKSVKNVVIIKMFGIGSIVLMGPMIRALKSRYPDADISFITFAGNKDIPKIYGMTEIVYAIRKNSFFNFLADTLKAVIQLRNKGISVSIDGEFFSRYNAVLSFLLGADYHIGFFDRQIYRGNFMDYHGTYNPKRHMTANFLDLTAPLSCEQNNLFLPPPLLSKDCVKSACEKLARLSLSPDKPIILFNSNTSDISPGIDRSWPRSYFVQVARHCLGKNYQIVFTGGPGQRANTEEVALESGKGAVSMAEMIGLEELMALMQMSFLLITNDSGPLHIAVSLDLPTFSFFGTESPVIYGHHFGLHRIFYSGLQCSPCLSVFSFKRGTCELRSQCMREITPEEVIRCFDKMEGELLDHFRKKSS